MTDTTTTAPDPGEDKPTVTLKRRTALIVAGALVAVSLTVGATVGGSGAGDAESAAQPAPTVTITAEPSPPPVSDESCRQAATELQSILDSTVNDALIPYTQISMNLVEMLQYGVDPASLEETATMTDNVTGIVNGLTQRTKGITPVYEMCVAP